MFNKKQYYQENKEKIQQQQKEYRLKNREKIKEYDKKWYQKNREKVLQKHKEYQQNNKEKINKYHREYRKNSIKRKKYEKEYRQKNKEKYKQNDRKFYLQNRKSWIPILKEKFGELKCSKCGYNKSFGALHFHHINGDKKYIAGTLLRLKPTTERIAEFDKCIILCANCHAEETWKSDHLVIS